eukprot:1552860-Rhodomonas_salina.1
MADAGGLTGLCCSERIERRKCAARASSWLPNQLKTCMFVGKDLKKEGRGERGGALCVGLWQTWGRTIGGVDRDVWYRGAALSVTPIPADARFWYAYPDRNPTHTGCTGTRVLGYYYYYPDNSSLSTATTATRVVLVLRLKGTRVYKASDSRREAQTRLPGVS